jgi:hypothetical protein
MANQHGGARPGAGRKKKADKFSTEIQAAERQIADKLPALIGNLIRLADGVPVRDFDPDGGAIVFERPPDRQANQYLIDRVLGRPTQAVEMGGEDGGPLTIRIEYADAPGDVDAAEAPPGPSKDSQGDEAI